MIPEKQLHLFKVSLVFKLIESSIATLSYFLTFFFWSVNYANMVYLLLITFGKCQDTQTLFEIYMVLTLSRSSSLSVFAGQWIVWLKSVNSTIFLWHTQKLWKGLYLRAFSIVIYGSTFQYILILFKLLF